MISFELFGIKIKLSFLFLCLISWFFLNDRDNIFLIYFFSLIFHEIGHIISIKIFKAKILKIAIKIDGITIKKEKELPFFEEIIVLASGCFSNIALILVFLLFKVKIFILVNVLIIAFNILPIMKLDGGQLLRIILERKLDITNSVRIYNIITVITVTFAVLMLIIILFYSKNINLLFVMIITIFSNLLEI